MPLPSLESKTDFVDGNGRGMARQDPRLNNSSRVGVEQRIGNQVAATGKKFRVANQSLSMLSREYFVPIFAMCMAVYCNGKHGKEISGEALCDSLLHIAKISELERDVLIKRNMVRDHTRGDLRTDDGHLECPCLLTWK
ncbi:hypothetical protein KSP39_PZI023607 [Platanthera zijinensis]|uniref:Uncharacterized protein n=1 Tax=Platanthera zijinensis TaxID=2320716 RepID=A0AAP0AST5_9ASPA